MVWETLVPAAIEGLGSLFGGMSQADAAKAAAQQSAEAQKYATREQLKFAREQAATQQGNRYADLAAYRKYLSELNPAFSSSEKSLTGLYNTPSSALAQMKNDILSGKNEAINQGASALQARLATSGIRGGQAALQLRRGIGEMTNSAVRDINQMQGNEALQRESEKRAYQAAMSQFLGQQKFNPNTAGMMYSTDMMAGAPNVKKFYGMA